jgi:hypothetical protein
MRFPVIATFAAAAALTLVATVPASSQTFGTGIPLNQEDTTKTPEQVAKQKATEDAYKATLRKLPDAKPADPWGNMRSVDTSAGTTGKPVQLKPKTAPKKTNSAAN